MKQVALCALPYLAACLVPAAAFGAIYSAGGWSPLWGLVAGGIALVGALLAQAVRVLVGKWRERARLDATEEWLRRQKRGEQ